MVTRLVLQLTCCQHRCLPVRALCLVWRPAEARVGAASVRRAAWLLAEWQLSAMNFLAVGCPNCWAKVPSRLQHLAATDVQARAFEALGEANLAFSRLSGRTPDPLSRGLVRFETMLLDFENAWTASHDRARPSAAVVDTSMAMPVDPSRVKVPKAAGAVQPAKVLPEHLGSTFLDAKSRVREG